MKIYIFPPVALILILFTACENELPFSIKNNPPKLILNALINADSTRNMVYLNFTGKSELGSAKESTLIVHINGALSETVHPTAETDQTTSTTRFLITSSFHPGDVIRIDAITNDSNSHAWAEVTVPKRPYIEKVDTCRVMLKAYGQYQEYMQYKIKIRDRENESNFYRIILERQNCGIIEIYDGYDRPNKERTIIRNSYTSILVRGDVVLTDGHPQNDDNEDSGFFDQAENIYSVFDDSRFLNQEYTLTVYSHLPYLPSDYYAYKEYKEEEMVRLLSTSNDEYRYLKALNSIDSDIYNEGINEPLKVPSNVHGGTGIVGVSVESSIRIHLL